MSIVYTTYNYAGIRTTYTWEDPVIANAFPDSSYLFNIENYMKGRYFYFTIGSGTYAYTIYNDCGTVAVCRDKSTNEITLYTMQCMSSSYHGTFYIFNPLLGKYKPFTVDCTVQDIPALSKEDQIALFDLLCSKIGSECLDMLRYDQVIDWIAGNIFTITAVPVYKDNTKINYTDGTYEVIDAVLTEQEAKDHAYKNLLNTYGTFYKATEVEINQSLNKMSS
jgi:hypothetical protein